MERKVLGKVSNSDGITKKVDVPSAMLIIGGAAIGTYVGFQIGGPVGAAVGALAAGFIKKLRVNLKRDGTVEVEYETVFA